MKTKLTDILNIYHPIIQAPMFLVSNTALVIEAMNCGIAGCIPALNYRTLEELRAAAKELKAAKVEGGSYGFNLIVNKSNVKYKGQLEVICEEGCDFIITSLGSPEETIKKAHKIVVLEHGCIVGMGPHDELLETCPLYKRLYDMQFSVAE